MLDRTLPELIHESWHKYLKPLFEIPSIETLKYIILPSIKFYPKSQDIFNVFRMPLDQIKVVILGQDPYPQEGQAIGYAFAVSEGTALPFSLKAIWKEVFDGLPPRKEGFIETYLKQPEAHTLTHWRNQGVFLLNTALTVEAGQPGTHLTQWSKFSEGVIRVIAENVNPIWMLWGVKAKAYGNVIRQHSIPWEHTYILEAGHPAAEAHNPGHGGFYGCRHFNKANEILKQQNKEPIRWL